MLSIFPREELDRTDETILDEYYNHDEAVGAFELDKKTYIKELNKEEI